MCGQTRDGCVWLRGELEVCLQKTCERYPSQCRGGHLTTRDYNYSAILAAPRYITVLCCTAFSCDPATSTNFLFQYLYDDVHGTRLQGPYNCRKVHAYSYPLNFAPPWTRYPTAVGPKPVNSPLPPSAATILRPAANIE